MSEEAGADGGHKTRDDPWMGTVTTVSGFLAGFSLAAVVVIADAPEHFRWPGVAVLALTIASVMLIGAVHASRNGAYYYEHFRMPWRHGIWVLYHGGIMALLAGLGAALAPLGGEAEKPGVAGQQVLRWAALGVAFAAVLADMVNVGRTLYQQRQRRKGNYEDLTGKLQHRKDCRLVEQGRKRFWCFGVEDAARLVIAPEADGFLMYRADEDRSWVIPRIESVEEWLDANSEWLVANKDKQEQLAAPRIGCRQALRRARRQQRWAPKGAGGY
jgi:hypothetical protein